MAVSSSSGRATPVRPTRTGAGGPSVTRTSSARLSSSTTASNGSTGPPTGISSSTSRLTAPTIASQARSVSPKKPIAANSSGLLPSANRINVSTPSRMGSYKSSASTTRMGNSNDSNINQSSKRPLSSRTCHDLLVTPSSTPIDLSRQDHAHREAIQAFLRIRPGDSAEEEHELSEPYIRIVDDKEVLMVPPSNAAVSKCRALSHSKQPSTRYTFAKVFPPIPASSTASADAQSAFFRETTLPMVSDLLHGESGLIFAYGVTNSGKSYTVLGGREADEAGLIPRAMDVVFNSIDGLQSESDILPVGLYGVERVSSADASHLTTSAAGIHATSKKTGAVEIASRPSMSPMDFTRDATRLKVDRNYRYSVWVSYVEVYNEKLYDLLDVGNSLLSPSLSSAPASPGAQGLLGTAMTRSESIRGSNWNLASMASLSDLSSLSHPHRRPLTLKADPEGNGKYVAGLRELRVKSVVEARRLLKSGQDKRVIFSTMANRTSSRSHGVFTIKIVREHGAGQSTPDESLNCTVSRLSIVDLAGSERINNTDATGERRKEAGNINKSLMCLGQCLETLRKNQARAVASIPSTQPLSRTGTMSEMEGRSSTPSLIPQPSASKFKRRPSVVPFRHSKLTELFQPFFTGEGRTVMIVNANPYDTGFDENNHVMRFSAVAKEVHISRGDQDGNSSSPSKVHRRLPARSAGVAFPSTGPDSDVGTPPGTPGRKPLGSLAAMKSRLGGTGPSASGIPSSPRAQKMATPASHSSRPASTLPPEISIIEEGPSSFATAVGDSEVDDELDSDEDSTDPFVDLLIARHEELRTKLFEAEKRVREIEAEVREEMANTMAERLAEMEKRYTERLLSEAESNEDFFNAKIDLLVRANSYEAQRLRARLDVALSATPRADRSSPRRQYPKSAVRDAFKTPRSGPASQFKTPSLVLPAAHEEENEVETALLTVGENSTMAVDETADFLEDQLHGQDGEEGNKDQSISRFIYLQAGPLQIPSQSQRQVAQARDESEDELITAPVRSDKKSALDEQDLDSEEDEEESEANDTLEKRDRRKATKEDLSFVADDDDDDDDNGDEEEGSMSSCSIEADQDQAQSEAKSSATEPHNKSKGKGDARMTERGRKCTPPRKATSTQGGAHTALARKAESAVNNPAMTLNAAVLPSLQSEPLRPSRTSRHNGSASSSSGGISVSASAKRARTTTRGKTGLQEGSDRDNEGEDDLVVIKDSPSKRKRLLHSKSAVSAEDLQVLAGDA